MPINVSKIVVDGFAAQNFTVHRSSSGTWINGNFIPGVSTDITMTGSIQPLTTKEIELLPEGDRAKGAVKIYTVQPLFTTRLNQPSQSTGVLADEITWRGERYKIVQIQDYRDYGYHKAIAVRKLGA